MLAGLALSAPALAQPDGEPIEVAPEDPELPVDLGDLAVDEPPPPDATDDAPPADEPPPAAVRDPKAAKKLAVGAARFAKKGDRLARRKKDAEAAAEYERALAAYEKSFELNPDAAVLVEMAMLEVKLARWVKAVARFRRALAETEVPLDARAQARAQAGLDDALTRIGVVAMTIVPDGAVVTIDGVEVGTAPLAEPLVLAPGEYALAIRADGFVAYETPLVVEAGSESERTFELAPVPVVVKPPRPAPPPAPPPLPPAPSKTKLYAGAGATLVFTGAAITTGVLALGKHGTFHDEGATIEERDAAQKSGRSMARLTDVFATGAIIAAGVTTYYYLKVYRPKVDDHERLREERANHRDEYSRVRRPPILVAPAVHDDGGGLVLTGWF